MKLKSISQRLAVEVDQMAREHPRHAHLFSRVVQLTRDGRVKCCIVTCQQPMHCRALCKSHHHRRVVYKNLKPDVKIQTDHKFYGERNPKWRGGQTTDGHGRVLVRSIGHPYANDWGYIYRYRIRMEKKLGRFLRSEEIVHHKDGNCSNDKLSNLEICDSSLHSKIHYQTRKINKLGQLQKL